MNAPVLPFLFYILSSKRASFFKAWLPPITLQSLGTHQKDPSLYLNLVLRQQKDLQNSHSTSPKLIMFRKHIQMS
jgi:hypothetical protein